MVVVVVVCDETAMCKCVPLNNTVTITLTGNINTAFVKVLYYNYYC